MKLTHSAADYKVIILSEKKLLEKLWGFTWALIAARFNERRTNQANQQTIQTLCAGNACKNKLHNHDKLMLKPKQWRISRQVHT